MELIFIGTGSGKTSLKRNHSSTLINSHSSNLLIDTGDGISKALLLNKISFNSIDNILITHFHADHFSGFASLITQMKLNNRKNKLSIFIQKNFTDNLKNFLNITYLFPEILGFDLKFYPIEINLPFKICPDISAIAKQNHHIVNKYKVDIREENFVSLSMLLNVDNKKIFYTSDIGENKDLYLFEDEKPDIMVSEITHISFSEIYQAFKANKSSNLFLTHIEDEKEQSILNEINLLSEEEKNKIQLCNDGLRITFN
ncbi:MBL fold metallo-hydrolase [Melioribacteraceae bacterium 4301-Me]|uniref:MBL fold metallo-hydrolase n=1 Tax=Pyranulibacter aquaticus TaxID=3163344 RepID=UPI003594F2EB